MSQIAKAINPKKWERCWEYSSAWLHIILYSCSDKEPDACIKTDRKISGIKQNPEVKQQKWGHLIFDKGGNKKIAYSTNGIGKTGILPTEKWN